MGDDGQLLLPQEEGKSELLSQKQESKSHKEQLLQAHQDPFIFDAIFETGSEQSELVRIQNDRACYDSNEEDLPSLDEEGDEILEKDRSPIIQNQTLIRRVVFN